LLVNCCTHIYNGLTRLSNQRPNVFADDSGYHYLIIPQPTNFKAALMTTLPSYTNGLWQSN